MTVPKPPTPQGISALLKRAGFEKSESRSTAIRGWSEWSAGYRVSRGYDEGSVHVEHRTHSLRLRDPNAREREVAKLAAYTETITAAGWSVQSGDRKLIVTAAKEQDQPGTTPATAGEE